MFLYRDKSGNIMAYGMHGMGLGTDLYPAFENCIAFPPVHIVGSCG